jgi:hypothetical protein
MDWWILVNYFIPRFWLGIKYYSLIFSWQVALDSTQVRAIIDFLSPHGFPEVLKVPF